MLDVHPPHAAAHTWKDFFVHIATICVGLLIAIGLEQSVERMHHRHELKDLREALRRDGEKEIEDAQHMETLSTFDMQALAARMQQVSAALRSHQPLAAPLPLGTRPAEADVPDEPAWKAAKASGLLALMPQDEIVIYSEVDALEEQLQNRNLIATDARRKLRWFEKQALLAGEAGAIPLSGATPDELRTYLAELIEANAGIGELRYWCRQLRGAQTAVLSGEKDLEEIQSAEAQFDQLP